MAEPRTPSGAQLVYVLRSLAVACDVLYLGAHPDDEENGLIALLTQHHGARVAYWSATRGEGGQSRVAAYTGDELGVYRTWESLDARQIDGAVSLFGPFIDYGFSKNGAEALEKWGERELVRELVRAIRIVQPQIVITRWRGDGSDGHGHHIAVGTAIKRAFRAAGEEDGFPELERVGLAPWQPRKLYQSMTGDWQPGEDVTLGVKREDLEREGCVPVNTGGFDPISSLTYQEQGALALQEHLTQGTGSVPTPGDYYLYLRLADVASGSNLDGALELFDGIEPTLSGLADYPGDGNPELRAELGRLTELARSAADGFRVDEPWRVARESLELVEGLRELETGLQRLGLGGSAQQALAQYVRGKRADAETAAAGCLGLRMDAALDRAQLSPGETVRLACRLWSYGPQGPAEVEFRPAVKIEAAQVQRLGEAGDPLEAQFDIAVPADAGLTSPYWLSAPHGEYTYVWPEVSHAGRPFDPSPISVTCAVRLATGESLELTRPALFAESFAGGHREFPLAVLPPISVQPRRTRHTLRARDIPQVLGLGVGVLGHRAASPIEGVLEIGVPDGWQVEPTRADISLAKAGDADTVPVELTVPANQPPGKYEVRYGIRCADRVYESSMTTVMETASGLGGQPDEGTCIRKQFIARPSVVDVAVIDVNVHEAHSYAYVAGIGDDAPRVLSDLGLSVRALTDGDLAHTPLAEYDTIVVGPNAFLVRDSLRKAAQRLLGYVHDGGTLVVQHQGYDHARLGAAPFPFRYNQPHDRVTLETSPVRILQPEHFFFAFPNRIDDGDFSGWVRDRGMYFFGEWDERYEPLLGSADPGESEKHGGLLLASSGRGVYAYCGYTLSRQLAAGVPGAFRLFANLLALPEARIRRRMERLRHVPLFETLREEGLHSVAEIATERRLSDGEYLFRQGDEGAELFIVDDGALDVLRGEPEEVVATYVAGTAIGELAPLTRASRLASVRARGRTHLFAIGSGELTELLRRQPDVAEALVQLLARRLSLALAAAPAPLDANPAAASYE